MRFAILVAVAAAVAVGAPAAEAHKGNPNYLSVINGVQPEGLEVEVINRDDQLSFRNNTGKDIEILGYENEPYVRIKADGTVEVNKNSTAYYLNQERFQTKAAPKDLPSEPAWEVVAKTGTYEFHDHRMHWMSEGKPEAVTDEGKKTKVFDWSVPVKVSGGGNGAVSGTLFWTPTASGGVPVGAIVAGAVIVILLSVGVIAVRRRRAAEGDGATPAEAW